MAIPVLHILVRRVILTHVVAQLSSLDLFATDFAGDEGVLLLDVLGQQLRMAVNGTALRAGVVDLGQSHLGIPTDTERLLIH